MAVKRIDVGNGPSESSEPEKRRQLPLLSDYGFKHNVLGKPFAVVGVSLTRDKGWIMVDTAEFRHMYAEGSAEYDTLLRLLPELHDTAAAQLMLVPERTRKGIGAYLATDEEVEVAYFWNPKAGIAEIVDLETLKTKKPLSAFTPEGMKARKLNGSE